MKEEFLHYLWKYRLFRDSKLKSVSNQTIEILNPGIHNHDAGPDFFNAKVKIDNTLWAGNVEIHVKSSDWFRHNHHRDRAFDNVILQVVYNHDKDVCRTNGQIIPTLEIAFDQKLLNNYNSLMKHESWISCQQDLKSVNSFIIQNWLDKLGIERLEEKSERINQLLSETNNSWETSFYILLSRNFGFKLNSEPFEQLAKSIPLKVLAKHKDNPFQIEALLFGQAGFLTGEAGDEYFEKLKKEYQYLQKKFSLKSLEKHLWKFLRSRPGNFPTVRIAQFAKLIYDSSSLFSKIIETKDIDDFYKLLIVKPSDYWENHYIFNKESIKKIKTLGKSAVDILLINTVIPFLFIYGKSQGRGELQERALELLEKIKPEKNSIISKWIDLAIKPQSAFESQALIHLKNNYCNHKKCLNCQIGDYLIKNINES